METQFRFDNMDSAESAWFNRELETIRAKTYDVKFPALKARDFIPVDNSVDPADEAVTYRQFDMVGAAKMVSSFATDFPRVDVFGKEFTSRVKSLGASYGYNDMELLKARRTGRPLPQMKSNAARRAVEELIDSLARTGDSSYDIKGFINASNTNTYTVPNGAAGAATFASKTPDEIVADLHGVAHKIVTATKEVEQPDTILMPLDQYTKIASTRMGDGSDMTILKHFLSTSPYIKNVAPWYALAGAGSASSDRMIAYRRDPDVLQLIIPQEFEQKPPQREGMEWVTYCHARCGGVVIYYPLAICFADGI